MLDRVILSPVHLWREGDSNVGVNFLQHDCRQSLSYHSQRLLTIGFTLDSLLLVKVKTGSKITVNHLKQNENV